MAEPAVQLNFRLPVNLYEKLEAYAAQNGKTKTEIVQEALESYLRARK